MIIFKKNYGIITRRDDDPKLCLLIARDITNHETSARKIFSIGHSTRGLQEFLALLREHNIEILADIRRWPGSERSPHFNRANLEGALDDVEIKYEWIGESLGGYRRGSLGDISPNRGWRSEGFRNFADYALSVGFKSGLERLIQLAEKSRTAYMCAERYFLRCHRQIISDHLLTRGWKVTHILDEGDTRIHKLTSFAVVTNEAVTYPPRNRRQKP